VTADEYAQDWADGLSGARAKIERGINRTTVAPGQKAAAESARYLTGVQNKVDLWKKRVGGVSLADWQTMFKEKGLNRIAQGVTSAKPAQVQMAQKLLAEIDAAVAEANKIPKGDIEQSVQRAAAFMRRMSKANIR
jgi:hypothetical protein